MTRNGTTYTNDFSFNDQKKRLKTKTKRFSLALKRFSLSFIRMSQGSYTFLDQKFKDFSRTFEGQLLKFLFYLR